MTRLDELFLRVDRDLADNVAEHDPTIPTIADLASAGKLPAEALTWKGRAA